MHKNNTNNYNQTEVSTVKRFGSAVLSAGWMIISNMGSVFLAGILLFIFLAYKYPNETGKYIKQIPIVESIKEKQECAGDVFQILIPYSYTSETLYKTSIDFLHSGQYSMCQYRDLLLYLHDNDGYNQLAWPILKDILSSSSMMYPVYKSRAKFAEIYANQLESDLNNDSQQSPELIKTIKKLISELRAYNNEYEQFELKMSTLRIATKTAEELESKDNEKTEGLASTGKDRKGSEGTGGYQEEKKLLSFIGGLTAVSSKETAGVVADIFKSGLLSAAEMNQIYEINTKAMDFGEEYPYPIILQMIEAEKQYNFSPYFLSIFGESILEIEGQPNQLKDTINEYVNLVSAAYKASEIKDSGNSKTITENN